MGIVVLAIAVDLLGGFVGHLCQVIGGGGMIYLGIKKSKNGKFISRLIGKQQKGGCFGVSWN